MKLGPIFALNMSLQSAPSRQQCKDPKVLLWLVHANFALISKATSIHFIDGKCDKVIKKLKSCRKALKGY